MVTSPPAPDLIGRASETAAVLDLMGNSPAAGEALVIAGEAGAGKSALLAVAQRAAEQAELRLLTARGVPAERDLPFAALHQLLSPLLGHTQALPYPLRHAVLSAFGLGRDETPPLFHVSLAALNLLAPRAGEQPVLALVDDLQWLDDASLQVLVFIARRLTPHRVVLLATARDGWLNPLREAGLPELRLDGLAAADAERLLSLSAPELDRTARRHVLQWADGNPLALRELPRMIHLSDFCDGRRWIPLTDRLQRAFADRLADLPQPTRDLLLAAALHPNDDIGEVSAAGRAVNPEADVRALPPAVAAGLISVRGGRVAFRHPLLRCAVYQAAALHDRLATHHALSRQPTIVPEDRVWHRLAATPGPDPDLAAQLHELASAYLRRGALENAVCALERSAALTNDEPTRGERLIDAASAALHLGALDQVQRLLSVADGLALTPRAARRSRLLWWVVRSTAPANMAGAVDLVEETSRLAKEGDPEAALDLLVVAARSAAVAGRDEVTGAGLITALPEIDESGEDPRCLLIKAYASPLRCGSEVIRAARRARAQEIDAEGLAMTAMAAMWVHAPEVASPLAHRAVEGLRRRGYLFELSQVLVVRGWAGFFLGSWEDALADATEGAQLSRETEQPLSAAALDVLQAVLLRLRGGGETFAASMTTAEQTGIRLGGAAVLDVVQLARGLVAMAEGSYEASFENLQRLYDRRESASPGVLSCASLTYLAEAAVHAGRVNDARAILAEVKPHIELTVAPQLHIALLYAEAVLAEEADAEPHYQRARGAETAGWPLDRARLELAFGSWLRRRRRAGESREPLRRAREGFLTLGAQAWAAQAGRELRAAGERSGELEIQQRHKLTAQELQIARLAAQGLSNREIGQQIYASPRTVGSHLYRIFPKLGITSRQQLGMFLVDLDASA